MSHSQSLNFETHKSFATHVAQMPVMKKLLQMAYAPLKVPVAQTTTTIAQERVVTAVKSVMKEQLPKH